MIDGWWCTEHSSASRRSCSGDARSQTDEPGGRDNFEQYHSLVLYNKALLAVHGHRLLVIQVYIVTFNGLCLMSKIMSKIGILPDGLEVLLVDTELQSSVLHSHWSRLNEARLSLVESVATPVSLTPYRTSSLHPKPPTRGFGMQKPPTRVFLPARRWFFMA